MSPGLQAASDCVCMRLTHQATRELNLIPQQDIHSLKAKVPHHMVADEAATAPPRT